MPPLPAGNDRYGNRENVDCSVTVFYMAQEDATEKSKLTTIMQPPGPRALYDTGVGSHLFVPLRDDVTVGPEVPAGWKGE